MYGSKTKKISCCTICRSGAEFFPVALWSYYLLYKLWLQILPTSLDSYSGYNLLLKRDKHVYLLLFFVLVFFMSGGPADLEQSRHGGLWIPSDLLQFLNQHSWVTHKLMHEHLPRHPRRSCPSTGAHDPDLWLRKQTQRLRPGDPWRSENYSEFSSQGSRSLFSHVCWSAFKHIH